MIHRQHYPNGRRFPQLEESKSTAPSSYKHGQKQEMILVTKKAVSYYQRNNNLDDIIFSELIEFNEILMKYKIM